MPRRRSRPEGGHRELPSTKCTSVVPNFWRLYPRVMDEVLPEERRLRGLEKLADAAEGR